MDKNSLWSCSYVLAVCFFVFICLFCFVFKEGLRMIPLIIVKSVDLVVVHVRADQA